MRMHQALARRANVEGNRPADEMRAEDQGMCRRVRLTETLGVTAPVVDAWRARVVATRRARFRQAPLAQLLLRLDALTFNHTIGRTSRNH